MLEKFTIFLSIRLYEMITIERNFKTIYSKNRGNKSSFANYILTGNSFSVGSEHMRILYSRLQKQRPSKTVRRNKKPKLHVQRKWKQKGQQYA